MSTNREQQNTSPAVVATSWLARRLAIAMDNAHRNSRRRIAAITLVVALASGIGTFVWSFGVGLEPLAKAFNAAALATIASFPCSPCWKEEHMAPGIMANHAR